MSALLSEIIADLKAARISYEEFLKRIGELAKQVQAGKTDDTPKTLDTRGKRALYNNLAQNEALALKIDETVRRVRPNAFRGNQAKENVIKDRSFRFLLTTATRSKGSSSSSRRRWNTDRYAVASR